MGIKILVNNANEAYVYNDQVQAQGLSVNGDYAWRYTPAVTDWLSSPLAPATVEFEFTDPKWETYFNLKWA